MASQKVEALLKPKVTPTLGLLGATVNAMALIAPGAFLWITYQLQAAAAAAGLRRPDYTFEIRSLQPRIASTIRSSSVSP